MLHWISQHPAIVIFFIFIGFASMEAMRGVLKSKKATREDATLEVVISLLLLAVIYRAILQIVMYFADRLTPGLAGSLSGWPLWAMFGVFLLGDDLTQYWWHRISHTSVLWPLHRAHHSAPHMGIRIVHRNNAFYSAMMPGLWISAYLIYLGFGAVYPLYLILKTLVSRQLWQLHFFLGRTVWNRVNYQALSTGFRFARIDTVRRQQCSKVGGRLRATHIDVME